MIKKISFQQTKNLNNDAFFKNYIDYLNAIGYSSGSVQSYLRCVKHYTHWISSCKKDISNINRQSAKYFFEKHLKKCKCLSPGSRDIRTNRAALFRMLKFLQIPFSTLGKNNPIEKIITAYDLYLKNMGGLSESTCYYRRRYAREFLNTMFKKCPLNYKNLTPEKIVNYISTSSKCYKRTSVRILTSSVRNFLKFLQFKGYCSKSIANSVPKIASWKLANIPEALNENQIKTFLSTFDTSSSMGKRNLAMARCLVDIGLRCNEVANLKLDNINWRMNIIEIKDNKTCRGGLLPMPNTLSKALIDYLKNARPKTCERNIFVHHRAPFGKKISPTTVRCAIRIAYKKSGFPEKLTGTHVLRKSMATRMLNKGRTLKEIADILRHRCIDTTMIYTKVDLTQLAKVALPCPGRVS